MPLTTVALTKAKAADKPFKIADGGGLYVLVNPNGSKLWRLDYRYAGKRRTAALGSFPAVALGDARRQRETIRDALRQGDDPALVKRRAKIAGTHSDVVTFRDVARDLVVRMEKEGLASHTVSRNRSVLTRVCATLGDRPVREVTSAEVLALLQDMERLGALETAKRARSLIGAVYRLAITTLRAENDPSSVLRGAIQAPSFRRQPALTEPKAIGALLRAIDDANAWPGVRLGTLFLALTFVRPSECAGARWEEIDLERRVWTVPAHRMKGGRRDHDVPLSEQAIEVLRQARRQFPHSPVVFPSQLKPHQPIRRRSFNTLLQSLGYDTRGEMTAHGFRAMASTVLNGRPGSNPDVIEKQLAHEDGSVRAIYNRWRYWDERVGLMQDWADMLEGYRKL